MVYSFYLIVLMFALLSESKNNLSQNWKFFLHLLDSITTKTSWTWAVGTYDVIVVVTDQCGNSATSTATIIIENSVCLKRLIIDIRQYNISFEKWIQIWKFVCFFFRKAPDISSLPSSSNLSEEVTSETNLKDLTVTDMQTYTCAISDVTPASGSAKFILKQTSGTSG